MPLRSKITKLVSHFKRDGRAQRLAQQQDQPNNESQESPWRNRGRAVADTAVVLLRVAKESSDWNPIAKSILGGVLEIVKICRQLGSNDRSWTEFADELESLISSIKRHLPEDSQEHSEDELAEVKKLASALEGIGNVIIEQQKRSMAMKTSQVDNDPGVIANLQRRLSNAFQEFTVLTLLAIRKDLRCMDRVAIPTAVQALDFTTVTPNIPAHFYGRDEVVNEAVTKLVEARINYRTQPAHIAIMGPGGMGKTSVASAILHHKDIESFFGSRIFFASCEAVKSGMELITVIMKSLNVPMLADQDPTKQFSTIISNISDSQRTVLCLDNFETTWDSEGDDHTVADVLSHLSDQPNVSILLTMRGTLVPLMNSISWKHIVKLEALKEDDAVQAFLSITHLPAGKDTSEVPMLVNLLDRIPLAIALVASHRHIQELDVKETITLWKEHWQQMEPLGTTKRDSLAISIDLSLKSSKMTHMPQAMQLLTILSHHPNGISLQELPSLISFQQTSLQSAKLLLISASLAFNVDNKRLQTLSPLRQHILNRYKLSPKETAHLKCHYFKQVSEWREVTGTPAFQYLVLHLEAEWGNISFLFLHWMHERDDDNLHEAIVNASIVKCHHIPDPSLLHKLLQVLSSDSKKIASCLQSIGNIHRMQNKYDEALEELKEAKAGFKRSGDQLGVAQCLQSIGDIHSMQSKNDEALEELEEAKAEFKRLGYQLGAAQCLQSIGDIHNSQSKYDEALEELEEAKAEFKRLGSQLGAAQCLQSIGDIHCMQSKYDEALEELEEAKAEFKRLGDQLGVAQCLRSIGNIHHSQSKYDEALEELEEAKAEFKRMGSQLGAAWCLQSIGDIHSMQSKYDEALEELEEAKAEFRRLGDQLGAAQCLRSIGDIHHMQSKYDEALEELEEAKAEFKRMGSQMGAAQCLRSIGDIHYSQSKYDEALEELEEAKAEFKRMGDQLGAAQCLQSIEKIHLEKANNQKVRVR